ncbi:transposase [Amycolatopsis mediterranei]|uniref:transposase n=1 Tax=Amycolatopsis mediterranei TaxID=33910 RepID=UPI0009B64010|nr:transposase [Amycolatopsis mediterranei]
MAKTTQQRWVEDRLWELIELLIPSRPAPRGPGGRPRIDDRAALEGILFVLDTGCRWRDLGSARGPRHHERDRSPGGACSRVADGTIDGDERALSSGSDQPSVGPPRQRRSMRSACGPRSL